MKLVIATSNPGKIAEISDLLENTGIEFLSLVDFPEMPEIIEDGSTFLENALKKAHAASHFTGYAALADDSGIEVDALGGKPGVMSARFAETSEERIKKMLNLMKDVPDGQRTARFKCALALVKTDGTEWTTYGSCEGVITHKSSGSGGFGYDPIFFYEPLNKTFAEIPREEKNKISHRGKALETFKKAVIREGILEEK
ncbi:XTP/dITP diphosphatase [Candidatus Latescibacterota bacterium]